MHNEDRKVEDSEIKALQSNHDSVRSYVIPYMIFTHSVSLTMRHYMFTDILISVINFILLTFLKQET